MKKFFIIAIIIFISALLILFYFQNSFSSFSDFKSQLTEVTSVQDNDAAIQQFWDQLVSDTLVPFIFGDSVAFLYKAEASQVYIAGDLTCWNSEYPL